MRKQIVVLLAALAGAAVFVLASGCGGAAKESPAPARSSAAAPETNAAPSTGAPIPGGGLTIAEALASTLDGPLLVKGYLIAAEGDGIRLCSGLLESYPPQCGEPSLVVERLDLEQVEGLTRPSDPDLAAVAWTEKEISLLGDIEAGVITVSETSI
jgi:hypothetical protein